VGVLRASVLFGPVAVVYSLVHSSPKQRIRYQAKKTVDII